MSADLRADVQSEVQAEMDRAVEIHGDLPRSADRCCVILTEEVGEAAQAVTEWVHERGHINDLRAELIQVIATAQRWINNIDEGVMIP